MNISRCRSALTIYVFFFFTIVLFSTKGVAMSMFSANEEEVVLFSPIEGKVTFEGKPAAGAKIVRWVKWKDEKGEADEMLLGADGEFSFPVKKDVVKRNAISKFVVTQRLTVFYEKEEFVIWAMGNGQTTLYGELGGKPKGFKCELTDDRVRVEVADGLLMTSCQWDNIEVKE